MTTRSSPAAVAPPRTTFLLMPLAFINFAVGAGAFLVIGMLSPLAQLLSMSKVQAGWVMSAYALGYALTSPLLIALTGGWRRRTVILAGIGIFIVASILSARAATPGVLYAARVLAAIGAGMVTPVAAAIAVATSTEGTHGKALSFVFAGMTIAQVVGVPGGAFIGYSFGPSAAFLTAAICCMLGFVWVALAVPRDVRFQPQSLATRGRTILSPPHLVAALLTVTIATSGYLGVTFMGPLAELRLGMGGDGVTLMLVAGGSGAFVGNIIAGRLTDRLGASRSLLVFLVGQALLLPAFTLIPFGLALGLALSFCWFLVSWGFTVPQQTRLMELDARTQGVMLALNAAGIYLGSGIGAAIAGVVYEDWGIEATGIVGGLIATLAIMHLLFSDWLVRRTSRATS
ncbi:MAG: MFS transporter [Methylobacteriaceae bacterium]|nr:MFS transporter [Methylobacteriaceae bacterium]